MYIYLCRYSIIWYVPYIRVSIYCDYILRAYINSTPYKWSKHFTSGRYNNNIIIILYILDRFFPYFSEWLCRRRGRSKLVQSFFLALYSKRLPGWRNKSAYLLLARAVMVFLFIVIRVRENEKNKIFFRVLTRWLVYKANISIPKMLHSYILVTRKPYYI